MRHKLPLVAVLLGVFPVALGATFAWSGRNDYASAANPTPTVIATVPVGASPRLGVGVNPATNRIYVANVDSNDVSVIDGTTNTEIDTDGNPGNGITRISVGSGPAGVGVNTITNRIYVANQWSGDVSVIDGATNTVVATVPVAYGLVGVGVNTITNRIYVGNWAGGWVSVIDGATNTEIDTDGNPANGITHIPVGFAPHLVAVNPTTNRIYVANWGSDNVSVIDGATNTEIDTDGNPANGITRIPVASGPVGVAVNSTTNRIHVTNWGSDNVSVIDGATNTEIDTDGNPANGITRIPVGSYPQGIAANPATGRVYVANSSDNSVSVIDASSNTVVATVPVGSYAYGVAANPTTNRIYVANRDDNTVSVIYDPVPVGGIAEYSQFEPPAADTGGDIGSFRTFAIPAVAAGAIVLLAGAWYARRRWLA